MDNFQKDPENEENQRPEDQLIGEGRAIFADEELLKDAEYKPVDLSAMTESAIKLMTAFSSSVLGVEDESLPVYHPVNLDKYFFLWGSAYGFSDFEGAVTAQEHALVISLAFGKYMNETYGFEWKEKTENGERNLVLWCDDPKAELYPTNSVFRGIQQNRKNMFTEIERAFLDSGEIKRNL